MKTFRAVMVNFALILFLGSGFINVAYGQEKKMLDNDKAFKAWLGHKPVTSFKVTAKFDGDHVAGESTNNNELIDKSMERYQKSGGKNSTFSWLTLDQSKLTQLVKSNLKSATTNVHSGEQQLNVLIPIEHKTVTLTKLTGREESEVRNQFRQGKSVKNHREVKVGSETHYVSHAMNKKTESFMAVGKWDLPKGSMDIYHYQAGNALPSNNMLERYRNWFVDDTGNPTAPVSD